MRIENIWCMLHGTIVFLGPENGSLGVKIKALGHLEAEIWAKNMFRGGHFVKSKMAAIMDSPQMKT